MPIKTLRSRLPEIGRLRLGHRQAVIDSKTGKQRIKNGQPVFRPVRGEAWRVTTKDEELLQYVAGMYGGEVKPWEGAPGTDPQWELFTESAVLQVIIPPGKLRFSQWYECWQRNLCLRRCDGETEQNSDGPCRCKQEAEHPRDYACKPTTRLSVVLDEIPSVDVWRVELHGIHGAEELAGTAELLEAAGAAGKVIPATLALEQQAIPSRPVFDPETGEQAVGKDGKLAYEPAKHIVLARLRPLPSWLQQASLAARQAAGQLTAPPRELEAPAEQEGPGRPGGERHPAGPAGPTATQVRQAQAEATGQRGQLGHAAAPAPPTPEPAPPTPEPAPPTPEPAPPTPEQVQALSDAADARRLLGSSPRSYQDTVAEVVKDLHGCNMAQFARSARLETWQDVLHRPLFRKRKLRAANQSGSGAGTSAPPGASPTQGEPEPAPITGGRGTAVVDGAAAPGQEPMAAGAAPTGRGAGAAAPRGAPATGHDQGEPTQATLGGEA
jgi:hypothetical protein